MKTNSRNESGVIYFLQAESGPIKIGFTTDLAKRVKAIQCMHHEKLNLLLAIGGSMDDESWFHHDYRQSRIKGEWFKPGEIVSWIKMMKEKSGFTEETSDG